MKKINYFILLGFFLVITLSFVSSLDSSYLRIDSDDNDLAQKVEYSSVLLDFVTTNKTVCRYSDTPGISYNLMEGVFDEEISSISHRKTLTGLTDGTTIYYIKCKENYSSLDPEDFKLILKVNTKVAAQIILDKSAPLSSGKIEIKLVTSKILPQTPSLKYSIDGITYNPIVLIGSENLWKGALFLEEDSGEGVLSFKFEGKDLEGITGSEIKVGSYFTFDTISPDLILDVKAECDDEKLDLTWDTEESISKFKIYKSEFSNIDSTDYYKTVTQPSYTDTNIDLDTVYYYRILAVDSAGNEGELSKEFSGICLSDDSYEGGLNPKYISKVDSLLKDVTSLENEIKEISSLLKLKNSDEIYLFNSMGFSDKLSKSSSDLIALKKTIEGYKSQDLTEEDLNSKLSSSSVKLGVIEKSIPEDFLITENKKINEEFSNEEILSIISKSNSLVSDSEKEKSLKETLKLIEDNKLKVESNFYNVKVIYYDGNSQEFSVVKRNVLSEMEIINGVNFIESLSSNVVSSIDEVIIFNKNYDVIDENTVFSFLTDTKEILYYFPKISNFNNLENIEFSLIKIVEEEENSSGITGFSIFHAGEGNYYWLFGLIIFALFFVYFIYSKNNDFSDDYFRLSNKLNDGIDYLEKGNISKAKEIYSDAKLKYTRLKQTEKRNIYLKVNQLYNEILIGEINNSLLELEKTKNKNLLKNIEDKINHLMPDQKNKVVPFFNKLKGDIENEN